MEAELLPPARQTLWGRLAVANFFLGGTGAGAYVVGAYVVGALVSGFELSPSFATASLLGAALVATGFLCVAVEAGRPLRGLRVLRMVRGSWMSRELWAGGVFIVCAVADIFLPWIGFRFLAGFTALIFTGAQGAILAQARGVAAWDMPLLPFVFLTSGLAAGAGLLGVVIPVVGDGDIAALAWAMAALILLSGWGWVSYLSWWGDPAFRQATRELREAPALARILGAGHLLPLLLLGVGRWFPELATGSLVLSGACVLIGAVSAKAGLVLGAGHLRPITVPALGARLAPSRERPT